MSLEQLNLALLTGPAILLAAVVAVRLSVGTGFPSMVVYLALGLAIGEGGIGLNFDDAELTGALGYAALVLILAEGGLTTRWATIKPSVAPAALLATLGTVVSVAVAGTAAHLVLDLRWPMALLLGAAISSTDAAAVFSVLRRVPLPPRLVGMLEAESGFNDAPVVIIVVTLTAVAGGEEAHGVGYLVAEATFELVVGGLVGVAVGRAGAAGLRRLALPSSGLYPISVLALSVGAYGAATSLHASGFLATYLASLVLGNSRLPHGAAVRGFAEGVGWIAQIGLFVLLGVLAAPSRLLEQVGPAIVIGSVLLLLARPLSVLVSVSAFRVSLPEQAFLSWAGLRGAVPVVLATIPVASDVPDSRDLFDLVFVLVAIFTMVQAPTLPGVARRLRLTESVMARDLDVEASPLGELGADVLTARIGPASRLHGVEVFELRLPAGANLTLVRRGAQTFVPAAHTRLRHGDDLIVVTTAAGRETALRRLQAVSTGGKLAGWRVGADAPTARLRPPVGMTPAAGLTRAAGVRARRRFGRRNPPAPPAGSATATPPRSS